MLSAVLGSSSLLRKIGIVVFVQIFEAVRELISKIAAQVRPPRRIGRRLAFYRTLEGIAIVTSCHKSSSMAVVRS